VTLTVAGSGHIAGIINPPAAKKYQHWTNDALPATLAEWQAGRRSIPAVGGTTGRRGLRSGRAAGFRPAIRLKGPLKPIEPAPGSYVKVQS
jgi:polyhydroxyalkanoate synthase